MYRAGLTHLSIIKSTGLSLTSGFIDNHNNNVLVLCPDLYSASCRTTRLRDGRPVEVELGCLDGTGEAHLK